MQEYNNDENSYMEYRNENPNRVNLPNNAYNVPNNPYNAPNTTNSVPNNMYKPVNNVYNVTNPGLTYDGITEGIYLNDYTHDPGWFNEMVSQGNEVSRILATEQKPVFGKPMYMIYQYRIGNDIFTRAMPTPIPYQKDPQQYIASRQNKSYEVSYYSKDPKFAMIGKCLTVDKKAEKIGIKGMIFGLISIPACFLGIIGLVFSIVGFIDCIRSVKRGVQKVAYPIIGLFSSVFGFIFSVMTTIYSSYLIIMLVALIIEILCSNP